VSTTEIAITIRRDGSCEWLGSRELDSLENALGSGARIRLSHIEPVSLLLRVLFRLLRACVPDESHIAGWTRRWRCDWRINIINGPTWGCYGDRENAIADEHSWLVALGRHVVRHAIVSASNTGVGVMAVPRSPQGFAALLLSNHSGSTNGPEIAGWLVAREKTPARPLLFLFTRRF